MMSGLARVVPAILTDDPGKLQTLVRQTETFTDYVQFDFMDGRFVPSTSITCEHLAALNTTLTWEAHLMVLNPETYLERCRRAGAHKVIFHFESTQAPRNVISEAKRLGLGVGLAANPETPVTAILPLLAEVDSVLLLTVHPGFYGARFLPEVLDKVAELRAIPPATEIGVDGGVKEENAGRIAGLGVDVLYVGSAISLQPDPAASFRRLQALAQEGSSQRRH
ncbi:MAG: ribulose-phosphate 3-epimerase [Chloroflexi bacterium]|nr:ribulose-phosphate 3-epimerase [Chloroflexota bacterium]